MRPTPWTYALCGLQLASLAIMYVVAFVLGAEPLPLSIVVIAGALAAIGAWAGVRGSLRVPRPRVRDVLTAGAATALALFLCREMAVPPIIAVSLVAITLGMMAAPRGPLDHLSRGAGYVGAFVGLLAPSITVPSPWVVASGAVGGLLWSMIGPGAYSGVGGRLGLVAFMASSAVYWFASSLGYEQGMLLVPDVNGLAHAAMVPIGAAGAVITWVLINRRGWDFTLASGVTSLAVCGCIAISDMGTLSPVLATAWFGGTMVGLSTPARLPNAAWVAAAGMMYGAYMLHFEGPLQGHVGVIGATGVIAVFVAMGALRLAAAVMSRRSPAASRVPA